MEKLLSVLKANACRETAEQLKRFFKTGVGEYGEGDMFLGIKVPALRALSRQYTELSFPELSELLHSTYHEARLIALLILVTRYKKAGSEQQQMIFEFYHSHFEQINNWDLVDQSAAYIAGSYLFDKSRQPLHQWAQDSNMWIRRIAMVATHYFIRQGEVEETLCLAKQLLNDDQDLIHKASGWMLREVGKRNVEKLEVFLQQHYQAMPRTMLRYAIEKFPEERRQAYLKNNIVCVRH